MRRHLTWGQVVKFATILIDIGDILPASVRNVQRQAPSLSQVGNWGNKADGCCSSGGPDVVEKW